MGRSEAHRRSGRALRMMLPLVLAAAAVCAGACGGGDDARSENRPPVPINVSVQVGADKITASPAKFGAGPITLLITNQSRACSTPSRSTARA